MALFNPTDILPKITFTIFFFSITYLIFASSMYFTVPLPQLNMNQTNINTPLLIWKW